MSILSMGPDILPVSILPVSILPVSILPVSILPVSILPVSILPEFVSGSFEQPEIPRARDEGRGAGGACSEVGDLINRLQIEDGDAGMNVTQAEFARTTRRRSSSAISHGRCRAEPIGEKLGSSSRGLTQPDCRNEPDPGLGSFVHAAASSAPRNVVGRYEGSWDEREMPSFFRRLRRVLGWRPRTRRRRAARR